MMRKSLKRVLDRLRAKTTEAFRNRTAVRGGLQEPQQMQGGSAPIHGRP